MRKLFALFMAAALTAQMLVPAWAEGFPVDPDSAGEPTEEIVYDEPTEDLDAVGDPDPAGAQAEETVYEEPVDDPSIAEIPEPAGAEKSEETPDANGENVKEEEPAGENGAEAAPQPIRVAFHCTPEDMILEVFPADGDADQMIEPEEAGSYLLLPGEYSYLAAAEGYETAAGSFTVESELNEPIEINLILEQTDEAEEIELFAANSNSCGEGLTWRLSYYGTLTISGTGRMDSYSPGDAPWYSQRTKIRKITISEGVTSIGEYAFEECTNVTSISIPSSVTELNEYCFSACKSMKNITIPQSVTRIADGVFDACEKLTDIYYGGTDASWKHITSWNAGLGGNVTIHSTGVFTGKCGDNLTWKIDNDEVLTISGTGRIPDYNDSSSGGNNTAPWYGYAYQIKKVVLGSGVQNIGNDAFADCYGMTDITIPDGVTSIGDSAFDGCSALTEISIPGTVSSIGDSVFSGCSALTEISIPDTVSSIGDSAFSRCSALTEISIPSTVSSIGSYAFSGCALREVEIPQGITSIQSRTFQYCTQLTKITIPDSVTSVETCAFDNCPVLKNVYYGGTEAQWEGMHVDNYAGNNSALLDATLYFEMKYQRIAAGSCGGNLRWSLMEDGVLKITGSGEMPDYSSDSDAPWYRYGSRIKEVRVGANVTKIGENAFRSTGVQKVVFCAKETGSTDAPLVLGNYCFAYCDALNEIQFGNRVIVPGDSVFVRCSGLTEVTVPGTVKLDKSFNGEGCGYGMFSQCPNLTKATVECSYVGPYFFEGCYKLTEVRFTDPNVQFYSLDNDNYGHPFHANSPRQMNVTVYGYTCSKVHTLVQANGADVKLTFQSLPGDSTKHTIVVQPAVEATCTSTGLTEGRYCSVCKYVITAQQETGKKDHEIVSVAPKQASCSEPGNQAHWKCRLCGTLFADEAGTKTIQPEEIVIDQLGHDLRKVEAVAPTHTEDGNNAYYICRRCGSAFRDSEGKQPTTVQDETLAAEGHKEVIDPAVKPTCTEAGKTEGSHCSVCGKILKAQEEIKASGHKEVIDSAVEPTCTKPGLTAGKHCSVCGKVLVAQDVIPANGHDEVIDPAVEPTCTKPGLTEGKHCSVCQEVLVAQKEIPASGHKEVIDPAVKPTCTKPGLTEGKHCSVCQEVLVAQKEIPASGHKEVVDQAVKPTCTKPGLTEGKHCSVCQEVLVAQKAIPASGHKEVVDQAVAPTCTKPGKTEGSHCSVCRVVLVAQNAIPASGHEAVIDPAVEPTCTKPGLTEGKHCSVCQEVLVEQKVIPASGHEAVIDPAVEPTCTKPGLTEGKHCSVCQEVLVAQKEIPASGHKEVIDPAVKPTCTKPGLTEGKHCSVCQEVLVAQKEIPASGHKEVVDQAVEPTCTKTGLTEGKHCSVCQVVLVAQQTIPAMGHSMEKTEAREATCTENGNRAYYTCKTCGKIYADAEGTQETSVPEQTVKAQGHAFGSWTRTQEPAPGKAGKERRTCSRCTAFEERDVPYTGSALNIAGTELEGESQVTLDGVAYPIQKDGEGNAYVDLPVAESYLLTAYSYNDAADAHSRYPIGMRCYRLTKNGAAVQVERLSAFDNLLRYAGTSIRLTGNKGIRMITSVDGALKSALIKEGVYGLTLVEYGTVLARASAIGGGNLTLQNGKSNYAYKRGVADPVFAYAGSLVQYTNVLVGFSDEDCKEDIAMRPYIILQDAAGTSYTLYGGMVYRSIGYVAYQNRNSFRPGTAAYDYVWEIIHYVYGSEYDSEYKG